MHDPYEVNDNLFKVDLSQDKLKPIMITGFRDANKEVQNKNVSYRDACFIMAISRIIQALRLRGRVNK